MVLSSSIPRNFHTITHVVFFISQEQSQNQSTSITTWINLPLIKTLRQDEYFFEHFLTSFCLMYPKRISSSLLIYPLFWYFSQGEAYLHITINTIYPPLSYEFQLKYLWKTCNSEVWGIDGPSLLVKMKYFCCFSLSRHHSLCFIVWNQAS